MRHTHQGVPRIQEDGTAYCMCHNCSSSYAPVQWLEIYNVENDRELEMATSLHLHFSTAI